MAVTQERPERIVSHGSERDVNAPTAIGPETQLTASRLIGLSIWRLEWGLALVRMIWVVAALVVSSISDSMESVRGILLIASLSAAGYGVGVAMILRAGAIREAALLGIALDAALVITMVSVVSFQVSRNDSTVFFATTLVPTTITALVVSIAMLRLRLWPAIGFGLFMTVVPTSLAVLLADDSSVYDDLVTGGLRTAAGASIFGLLGQIFQRTRLDMIRSVADARRLYAESEREAGDRGLLVELGGIVSQSLDVRETYERFAETVRSVLPADRVSVNVYDEDRDLLVTTYISGTGIDEWQETDTHTLDETALGLVVREGRGLVTGGTEHRSSNMPSIVAGTRAGLHSAAAVPLRHQGKVIGTLGLRSSDPDAYDEDSLFLLDRIGEQVAPAVANARLYSALEREAEERTVFAEISRILTASPDISDVYDEFAAQVGRLISWDRISLNVIEPSTGRLRTAYAAGLSIAALPTGMPRPPGSRSVLEYVARTGESLIIDDIRQMRDRFPDSDGAIDAGLLSGIYVPLVSNGVFIGTIATGATKPNGYTRQDLELLERIAAQVAGTFANAELRRRTDRQAHEEAALAEISRVMTSSLQMEGVYEQFAKQLRALMPADRVSLIDIDVEPGYRSVRYVNGLGMSATDVMEKHPISAGGLLEAALRSDRGLMISDLDAQIDQFPGSLVVYESGIRSVLYVPLRSHGVIVGILGVASKETGTHTDYHFELLQRVSGQIAGVIANAQLHEQADRQASEESVLAEIGRIINSSLGIETIYDQFAEQVDRILPFDRIAITRLGPGEGEYTISHVTGAEVPGLEVGTVWKLDETPFGPALRGGETMFLQSGHPEENDDFARGMALSQDAGISSSLVVPLIQQDRPIGFFSVRSRVSNAFTEHDAVLARRVAALVSSAITNSELLTRSNRQADEEAALGEIGRIITASLNIEDVYGRFAEHLRALMPADRVSVIEIEPDSGEMSIRYVREFPDEAPRLRTAQDWRPNDLMTQVAETGESLWVPDIGAHVSDNEAMRVVHNSGVRSLLYTPLRSQQAVIGLLCVVSTSVDAHNETHSRLLERISAQIAGALANAKLHERSAQQAREEAALGQIGRIINASLDVEAIYDQFADQVQLILPFDRLAIAIRNPDKTRFTVAHITGVSVPGLLIGTTREIADTNLVSVFEDRETLIQQGGEGAERVPFVPGVSEGLSSSVIVPLISRDEAIGFLALRSKAERAYSRPQIDLAQRVATLVSTAIFNSELYERAEAQATERAVLAEIGRIAGSSLDIDAVYERFVEQVGKLIEFDRISISYVTRNRNSSAGSRAYVETQTGFGIGREIPARAFIGTRLGRTIRRRRGAVLDEAEINEFFENLPWPNEINARSMMCVPLISDGNMIAGLAISSIKPGSYDDRDLEIAVRVGGQIAGAAENARLHGALQQASEELKDINKQKTELMTNVAHELRSPLTALNAFMELVLDGTAGEVPEQQHSLLSKAYRSSARMQGILSGFSNLEMAEDARVPLTLTMIDIETSISNSLDLLQPAADHSGIGIKFEPTGLMPLVEADRQAVGQVVSNLASNAIKYSREGDLVTVNCEVVDDEVVVSVTDTGIGISPEDQERLFERFYRGSDPAKLQIGGTGLGLYVSKGLVERHNGRLWCQSEPGSGSRFSFAIPIEQPEEASFAAENASIS